jgi:hypothetical protein
MLKNIVGVCFVPPFVPSMSKKGSLVLEIHVRV